MKSEAQTFKLATINTNPKARCATTAQALRLQGKCSTRVVLLVSEICQPFESDPDDDGEGAHEQRNPEFQVFRCFNIFVQISGLGFVMQVVRILGVGRRGCGTQAWDESFK